MPISATRRPLRSRRARPRSRCSARCSRYRSWSTSAARRSTTFRTQILVRFGDLDAAGIAYYPRLVNFLHESFEDFFRGHVGRTYPQVFKEGIAFPTVKVEMEFLSPVHYGDHVDIDVVIERIGRSSVQVRYEGSVEGRRVFKARQTAVVIDMKSFRPLPIPDWMRERFAAGMEAPQ